MPFPWKKNRVPRISQIVADLQSPKRGASLVVQTGFPTSLIDLFVKNRTRFKKNRSKKTPPPDLPHPPPPPPPPPPSPATPIPMQPTRAVPDPVTRFPNASNLNAVVFVKILMAFALIASVERLTVGITVSAFALLLLEYAGRRAVSFPVLAALFRKALIPKKERVPDCQLSREGFATGEIEVVEATTDLGICADVAPALLSEDEPSSEVSVACLLEQVSECKTKGGKSGGFRSRMVKKLVPKKFRGSRKEKKEKESESGSEVSFSSAVEDEKLPILEIEVEEVEEENISGAKNSSNTKLDCGITRSYDVIRVGNSCSSTVLVMVALVGLLLGRFPALILSITCCCLLKIVRSLRRSLNVSLIKCSVSNS